MEELQKTQDYAAERERRRMQEPYDGQDRRKAMSQPSEEDLLNEEEQKRLQDHLDRPETD